MDRLKLTVRYDRHHIRSTFYHAGILLFIAATIFWFKDIDWSHPYTIFCAGLIVVDYIAEMYDPHPDAPGKWFERHFHRFLGDDDDKD